MEWDCLWLSKTSVQVLFNGVRQKRVKNTLVSLLQQGDKRSPEESNVFVGNDSNRLQATDILWFEEGEIWKVEL